MSKSQKQRLRLQRYRVRQFERENPELFSEGESDSEIENHDSESKSKYIQICAEFLFKKKINLKKLMFSEYSKTDFSNFENALSLKNELCGFKKRSLNGRACVFTLRWAHAPAQSTCVKFFKI